MRQTLPKPKRSSSSNVMQFIKKHYILLFNALCLIVNCLICPCKSNGLTPPPRKPSIGLEEVWQTKWWPNQQFTFLLSVAEVNCVQARARGRKEVAEPTLTFGRKLAMRNADATQKNIIEWGPCSISPMPLEALIYQQSHPQKVKSEGR